MAYVRHSLRILGLLGIALMPALGVAVAGIIQGFIQ